MECCGIVIDTRSDNTHGHLVARSSTFSFLIRVGPMFRFLSRLVLAILLHFGFSNRKKREKSQTKGIFDLFN